MKRILNLPPCGSTSQMQSGFTLIELLVATVIGLLGTIVIFTVYQNAEGFKRTTIAAGDAQTSGAVALYTLEQYIRTSGSGITTTNEAQLKDSTSPVKPNSLLGCPLLDNPNGVGAGAAITSVGATTPIAPVRIIDGSLLPTAGGILGTSDVLVIMSGNADIATNPTSAGPVVGGVVQVAKASNLLGWRPALGTRLADIALFAQGEPTPPVVAGGPNPTPSPCTLRRISNTQAIAGIGNVINLARALPAATNFPLRTNVHDVGPTPYFISIGINAEQELVETSFLPGLIGEGATPVTRRVLAEGIVNIQAQYGIDNDLNDTIDAWVEPTNNTNGNWSDVSAVVRPGTGLTPSATTALNKIKAIRLAILARSQQYEAPNRATGLCNTTPVPPAGWFLLPASTSEGTGVNASLLYPRGADILPAVSLPGASPNGDWRCFRYRRFETIIPIINMVRSPL